MAGRLEACSIYLTPLRWNSLGLCQILEIEACRLAYSSRPYSNPNRDEIGIVNGIGIVDVDVDGTLIVHVNS